MTQKLTKAADWALGLCVFLSVAFVIVQTLRARLAGGVQGGPAALSESL